MGGLRPHTTSEQPPDQTGPTDGASAAPRTGSWSWNLSAWSSGSSVVPLLQDLPGSSVVPLWSLHPDTGFLQPCLDLLGPADGKLKV